MTDHVEYGVLHFNGEVTAVRNPAADADYAAEIARGWDGRVVTRTASFSLWTDEPSSCPRCGYPTWPSSLGAMHADGQTDCLLRDGCPT